MNIRIKTLCLALFVLFPIPSLLAQSGGVDELSWSSIDGGGGTSSGGVYSVSGTIAQPDAGAMGGGNYSVAGGFWSFISIVQSGNPSLLSIKLTSTNSVMVYWSSPSTGFSLQVNTDLATANWTTPAETIEDNGTIKYIITNPSTGNRFYRLTTR